MILPGQRVSRAYSYPTPDPAPEADPRGPRIRAFGFWYMAGMVATTVIIVMVAELLVMLPLGAAVGLNRGTVTGAVADAIAMSLISVPLIWIFVVRKLLRDLAAERRMVAATLATLQAHAESTQVVATLLRGMDLCMDEEDVLALATAFLANTVPGVGAELLLADAHQSHLRPAVAMPVKGTGCSVDAPGDCPALRGGQSLTFLSSLSIDACPRLRGRLSDEVSARCLPISLLGRNSGVMHAIGAPGWPTDAEVAGRLAVLSSAVGNRLSMIRALAASQSEALVDSLTGLANRRWFEANVARLERERSDYALLVFDVDGLKAMNDTFGHAVGDQVLRLFARVLRRVVRRDDVVARLGGDEFAVIMETATAEQAPVTAERLRTELEHVLSSDPTPDFTVSVGISDSSKANTFSGVFASADDALYRAKAAGRNRIEVAG